jgi:serine/threonine-protein kinase RsbT
MISSAGDVIPIASEVDVATARRDGQALAARLGFSSAEATVVATAICELARNIVQHARCGTITLRSLEDGARNGVLVVAADEGPGIPELPRAMAGGYSTSGGLGVGLRGVRSLVDDFEIASNTERGTTVIVRQWRRQAAGKGLDAPRRAAGG